MGYRTTVTRTIEGKVTVLPDFVVPLDGKRYVGTPETGYEEVEDAEVERHVTLLLGDTVLAEEWDFRTGLTFGECEQIEKLFGKPMALFEELVDKSALARKVLIHVLLLRQDPSRRLEQLDNVSRGDWRVTVVDDDIPEEESGPTPAPTASSEPAPNSVDEQPEPEPPTSDSSPSDA